MSKFKKTFNHVYDISITNDNKFLIVVSKKVIIYKFDTLEVVAKFSEIINPSKVTIAIDNTLLAVKSTTGKIGLYSLESLSLLKTYNPDREVGNGSNIWITLDNVYIIDGDWNGNIRLINIVNGTIKVIKSYDNSKIEYIDYSSLDNTFKIHVFYRGGKHISDNSYDRITNWKYDMNTKQLCELNEIKQTPCIGQLTYNTKFNYFAYLKLIRNRQGVRYEIIVMNDDFDSIVFSKEIGQKIYVYHSISFSPNGDYLVIIVNEKLQVYSSNLFELLTEVLIEKASKIKFSTDSQYIAVITEDWKSYLFSMDELLRSSRLTITNNDYKTIQEYLDTVLVEGMNKEWILSIPEDKLLEVIGRYALKKAMQNKTINLSDSIHELPYHLRLVYYIWTFQQEITEGGISQYLINNYDITRSSILECLKEIGADINYDFIIKYMCVYELKESQWDILDDEYESISENIEDLTIKYILKNLDGMIL